MTSHPSAAELVEAVARWIGEVRPQLDERNAFLARVAQNALAVVGRELTLGPRATAAATARLSGLLGHDGPHDDLVAELCARLRAGEMGVATPGLLETLRALVLDQLAIDQPGYQHESAAGHPGGARTTERP